MKIDNAIIQDLEILEKGHFHNGFSKFWFFFEDI